MRRPAFRHPDGRTDGDAYDAGGHDYGGSVDGLAVPSIPPARLGMGCIALVLMLVAEFGFVLWVRGLSIKDYLATRDPVSGTVYYAMLVAFAIMPLFVAEK
jgi:hypothetical protein